VSEVDILRARKLVSEGTRQNAAVAGIESDGAPRRLLGGLAGGNDRVSGGGVRRPKVWIVTCLS
jgi:hypothetical protein